MRKLHSPSHGYLEICVHALGKYLKGAVLTRVSQHARGTAARELAAAPDTRWEGDSQAAVTAMKFDGDRSMPLGLIQDLCYVSGTKWILQWMEMYGKRGFKMKNIFSAVEYMPVSFKRTFFKKMNSTRKEKHKCVINYDSEQNSHRL